jgi:hypothetical protein
MTWDVLADDIEPIDVEGRMKRISLEVPDEFLKWPDDMRIKGFVDDVRVTVDGVRYRISFYDVDRVRYEAAQCEVGPCYFVRNLVIVPEVTEQCMIKAVEHLFRDGQPPDCLPAPDLGA